MNTVLERAPQTVQSRHRRPLERRRRRFRPVVFAGCALAALAGLTAWMWKDLTPDRTVYVVGDSISALSRSATEAALNEAGFQATVRAMPGVKMGQAQSSITSLAQQQPWAWIIELGTNDAGARNPDWRAPFFAEWRAVSPAACVVYVTVSPRAGETARQVDAAIESLAQTNANVHVLDWGNIEYQNPAWVNADGIHPTPAGQAALARLESRELQQHC